ncbi:hypothetical protein HMPREF9141_0259 [Prevotella multiformis DSM 16608]|uniref:Uncharacterized protein n=1 Tax=Prevotella multiformis DSM 16608 TaxID=888743 RepID=F0F3U3_9BACT|nr:hypothetical protein HMPREF9141_0259 [Prevotella multiformis DSM 16608]
MVKKCKHCLYIRIKARNYFAVLLLITTFAQANSSTYEGIFTRIA